MVASRWGGRIERHWEALIQRVTAKEIELELAEPLFE